MHFNYDWERQTTKKMWTFQADKNTIYIINVLASKCTLIAMNIDRNSENMMVANHNCKTIFLSFIVCCSSVAWQFKSASFTEKHIVYSTHISL